MLNSPCKDCLGYCDGLLTAPFLSKPTFPDYYQGLPYAAPPLPIASILKTRIVSLRRVRNILRDATIANANAHALGGRLNPLFAEIGFSSGGGPLQRVVSLSNKALIL